MSNHLSLSPDLAIELDGLVRQTIARARMHNRRLARDIRALSDEQLYSLADADQLGAEIRAVVDGAISSRLHGLNGRNTCPVPEDLPAEILCEIWNRVDFRGRFAVTGVCRSWRNIGIATAALWQDIEFVTTSHSSSCGCSQCYSNGKSLCFGGNNITQVQMALARGGHCDIHLIMKMLVGDFGYGEVLVDDETCRRFWEEMTAHLGRVLSLTYVTDNERYLRSFPSAALPRLRIFRLKAMGSNAELCRRFRYYGNEFLPWSFDLDAPELEQFHSPNAVPTWPYTSSQLEKATHVSIGAADGMGWVRNMITACPRLEHTTLFVRYLNLPQEFPSELTQSRLWKTLKIAEIPKQLEKNELQQELDSMWDTILSLRAHDVSLEYVLEEDPYIVPSYGLRIFATTSLLGGFALKVVCLAGDVISLSRRDIASATGKVIPFGNIHGPVRSVTFHRDALSQVLGSASVRWLAEVWTLYLQLDKPNFHDTASAIISALPRMSATSVISLSVPAVECGQQFIDNLRVSTFSHPNLKILHIITPSGTTTELLSAST